MIKIEVINSISHGMAESIRFLIRELSQSAPLPDIEELSKVASEPSNTLMIASADGVAVGMLTLVLVRIPTGNRAFIEDVAVDSRFRRRGIGKALVAEAIRKAEQAGARTIDLTSRPSKVAANLLYESLGFERRDTNVFRLKLR